MTLNAYTPSEDEGNDMPLFDHDGSEALPPNPQPLMPRDTVAEIVRTRNESLDLFAKAHASLTQARDDIAAAVAAMMRASGGAKSGRFTYHLKDYGSQFHGVLNIPALDTYAEQAKRIVDTYVWQHVIETTGIETLMDQQARDELHKQMTTIPGEKPKRSYGRDVSTEKPVAGMPDVSEENIAATLECFQAQSALIFQRGVVNAFSKLDRRFRSHDGFKFKHRIILSNAFDECFGHWKHSRDHQATIMDIERALCILDGKSPVTFKYASIVQKIEDERRAMQNERRGYGPMQSEHQGEYFKVRCYENGNAHLWFSRPDLLDKVNRLLADYYGEVVGDGMAKEADPFANPKTALAKSFGFYPSPANVVREFFDPVGFGRAPQIVQSRNALQLRILEPSAGNGALARPAARVKWKIDEWAGGAARHGDDYWLANLVDCVEVQADLAAALKSEDIYNRVYAMDFLSLSPETTGLYDLVIMNPPFDRERDIDHVMHAWKFVRPGGSLHAIMSAGVEFRETKKSTAFRNFVSKLGGRFDDLPAGSFAEVGTYVNTCIVRLTKPQA